MLESSNYTKPGLSIRLRQRMRLAPSRNMFWSWYEPRNFGDWIGPYLFERITKKTPHFLGVGGQRYAPFYITAGSILRHIQVEDRAIIWGSGIITAEETFARPRQTFAVRGPRSQRRLRELGFPVPDVMGDPGILLPLHYQPSTARVSNRIGIVPHYIDLDHVRSLAADDVHVIDVTLPVEKVVDEIATCTFTLSSSLHGLIVSHAYGVPSVWCRSFNPLTGDGVKFLDYLESVGLSDCSPADLPATLSARKLRALGKDTTLPDIRGLQGDLAACCPFSV